MKHKIMKVALIAILFQWPITVWGATSQSANATTAQTVRQTGLTFKTFEGDIFQEIHSAVGRLGYRLQYTLAWPVSGNPQAVVRARNWIKDKILGDIPFHGDIASMNTPDLLIKTDVESRVKEIREESADWESSPLATVEAREFSITASMSGSNCSLSYNNETSTLGMGRIISTSDNITFNVSGRKSLSVEILNNIDNLSDLIWLGELAFGDKDLRQYFFQDNGPLYSKIAHLPQPVFKDNGIEFNFNIYVGGYGSVNHAVIVPYAEIVPLLNVEALQYIPQEALDRYFKDEGELTEDIVKRLWWYGLPDHGRANEYTGQALSRDFEAVVKRGWKLANDSDPDVIGDEECMYYWYSGQEYDEATMGITSVKIQKHDDTHATATVYFTIGWGIEPGPYILKLTKEPRTLRNGKVAMKWAIDDFRNASSMKQTIREFIRKN